MCDSPYSKLLLVFDAVWGRCNCTSCAILLYEYITTLILALHWSPLVECMERVSCGPWTNSAYVCGHYLLLGVRLTLLEAVIGARCSMVSYVILPHAQFCFVFRIHRNVDNGPCIDLRWLNVWNGCRVGPGWTARTFVTIAAWCAIGLTRSCYWCLMQYWAVCNFTSCAILLCEYIATLTILWRVLLWSSLIECMERVTCWSWMNSLYVYSLVCSWPYLKPSMQYARSRM